MTEVIMREEVIDKLAMQMLYLESRYTNSDDKQLIDEYEVLLQRYENMSLEELENAYWELFGASIVVAEVEKPSPPKTKMKDTKVIVIDHQALLNSAAFRMVEDFDLTPAEAEKVAGELSTLQNFEDLKSCLDLPDYKVMLTEFNANVTVLEHLGLRCAFCGEEIEDSDHILEEHDEFFDHFTECIGSEEMFVLPLMSIAQGSSPGKVTVPAAKALPPATLTPVCPLAYRE